MIKCVEIITLHLLLLIICSNGLKSIELGNKDEIRTNPSDKKIYVEYPVKIR